RFFEAIRQIMKGEFRAEYLGRLFLDTSYGKGTAEYLKIESPVDAAFILILHLIGDFFSKMSLPIPGRSEAIKTDDKEIYKEIIREYMGHERDGQVIQRPENLRTQISRLLSNFTGSILISVVLRIYRYFSIFLLEKQSFSLSGLKLSDDM